MAILPIRIYPDPILRNPGQAVAVIGAAEKRLIEDMIETMFAAPGAGLAAPQVGVSKRIIIVNLTEEENVPKAMAVINPQILEKSGEESAEEGCLSVPDYLTEIKRCTYVRVRFLDIDLKPQEIEVHDFLARVFQHEIDHLEGILFFERLGRIKRDLVRRRLIKSANKIA